MTQAISGAGGIVRIVDLTFRLSGISEQSEQIQDLTRRAQMALNLLTSLYMTYRLVMTGMGPIGWVMLAATAIPQVAMIAGEFTDTEESTARGR